jgi:hypothetical protein
VAVPTRYFSHPTQISILIFVERRRLTHTVPVGHGFPLSRPMHIQRADWKALDCRKTFRLTGDVVTDLSDVD